MRTYFLFLLVVVISCSDQNPKKNGTRLAEVYRNGSLIQKYEYTGERIQRESLFSSDGSLLFNHDYVYDLDTVFIYRYDSENKLVYYRKFYTINESQSRRDRLDPDHNLMEYRIYIFDDAYCGFVGINYYDAIGELGLRTTQQYTDTNCSMVETGYNSDDSVEHTLVITRDDQNYYLYSTMLEFYRSPLFGNAISYDYKNSDNSTNPYKSFSSEFEYNSSGYPIAEVRNYEDGSTSEFSYRYY